MADIKNYSIATLGSHTALQILKGARDEGFKTICICAGESRARMYEDYGLADEVVRLGKWADFFDVEDQLIEKNAILIPHGSYVQYIGAENVKKIRTMHYGEKGILEWESDRNMERKWLEAAGLTLPRIFKNPTDIDRPVIVKFHGAKGGQGYFIANSPEEFHERIKDFPEEEDVVIQEYIVGVPIYTHYFQSPLHDTLEIMSFDKRYESNADSIGRIAARDQLATHINTTYTIAGNMPIVIRESLLPKVYDMGKAVVAESKKITKKGLYGPFCLEAIVDPNLDFYVFEISARIVAGTNPYINGSPYTWLRYSEPMSTGRRLARDIREAIEQDKIEKILG